jgi:putative N6-adenine-specific DNA methylase
MEEASDFNYQKYMEKFKMLAKTFAGLEEVLADELRSIGAEDVKILRRAVSFKGDTELLYKANFCVRTALRILKPIAEFKIKWRDDLYRGTKKINWEKYISTGKTIAVDSIAQSELFMNSMFVSLKVKDAIVDQFRAKTGKRPSVDTDNPDLKINVHLMGDKCTISLDSSGESLHKRGYRVGQTEAPINEVLAAGLILLSGWDGKSNFMDPMCGSGTLLIEAAMIGYGVPPGMYRPSFGFESWADFDKELFEKIYNSDYEKDFAGTIFGSDLLSANVSIAMANIKNAGFQKKIQLQCHDFATLRPPFESGIIITNPPYGERLMPKAVTSLYTMMGDSLKARYAGFRAWIISSSKEGLKSIGLRSSKRITLYNGALECSYRSFDLFKGSGKGSRRDSD